MVKGIKSDATKVAIAATYFGELAQKYFMTMDRIQEDMTWSKLVDNFRAKFMLQDFEFKVRPDFRNMKQASKLCDYVHKFLDMTNGVSSMSDKENNNQFIAGLETEPRKHVVLLGKNSWP